tara:strand:- start:18 stop:416 length:399 start_codon:yes stop_codon:yes gene_type:complete
MLSKLSGKINFRARSMSTLWNKSEKHRRMICAPKDTRWSTEPPLATDHTLASTVIHAEAVSNLRMDITIAAPATRTITKTVLKWMTNSKPTLRKNKKKKQRSQWKKPKKIQADNHEGYNIISYCNNTFNYTY